MDLINKDYKHFNIEIQNKNNHEDLDINNLSFKQLWSYMKNNYIVLDQGSNKKIKQNQFIDSVYDRHINLTEDILNEIIKDNIIIDKEKYKIILFINCINEDEIVEEYDLFDEDTCLPKLPNINEFQYIFNEYFDNKYKEKNTIDNEYKMSRLHLFDFHYSKIYPNNFNKKEHKTQYNTYARNKSNLKTQYKKYLEGEDIDSLKNIPALKMMIYIIQNTPTN